MRSARRSRWRRGCCAALTLPVLAGIARAADAPIHFVDAAPAAPTVEARFEEIRRRIESALVYPPLARLQRVEGTAWLHFDIAPDGTPRDIEIARSSGAASLDGAAREAVQRAAPLPWVYGRIEVPVRFVLASRR